MDLSPLHSFIGKVQTAKNYNSKEIRLSLHDAESISLALSALLIQEADLNRMVIDLQRQIMEGVEVSQDGGKF